MTNDYSYQYNLNIQYLTSIGCVIEMKFLHNLIYQDCAFVSGRELPIQNEIVKDSLYI